MKLANRILVALLSAVAITGIAAEPPVPNPEQAPASASDGAAAIAAQRAWWKAYVVADMASLEARSLPAVSLTVSSGLTYDRSAMMAEAATHSDGHTVRVNWSNETVRFPAPGVAIVSSRVTEVNEVSGLVGAYRYLTVLQHVGNDWGVIAAHSTRELALTPRIPASAAGRLSDLEGSYLTPKGAILRIVVRDGQATLFEPSGKHIPLDPVAPGIFEWGLLSMDKGLVRMVFTRDESGKVVSFSRLLMGEINTFTKLP